LVQIFGHELAGRGQRVVGVEFDVLDGGMNRAMSGRSKILQASRYPAGRMPLMEEAARQLVWILQNPNWLVSGTTMTLNGGGLP
jgi:NAD(P)-dependent dehydrogenase (short-subunit alcohol dehydrogenase family)